MTELVIQAKKKRKVSKYLFVSVITMQAWDNKNIYKIWEVNEILVLTSYDKWREEILSMPKIGNSVVFLSLVIIQLIS